MCNAVKGLKKNILKKGIPKEWIVKMKEERSILL